MIEYLNLAFSQKPCFLPLFFLAEIWILVLAGDLNIIERRLADVATSEC